MGRLLLPVFKGRKILQRNRWPIAKGTELWDLRPCPDCGALVQGDYWQLVHQESHDLLELDLHGEPEPEAVEGYIVGHGGRVNGPDYHTEERER